MKIMKLLLIGIAVLALSVTSAMAHVHPLVPFQCAPAGTGAGNTADPQNDGVGQTFIGTGFIPSKNPGNADVLPSPGVGRATALSNCADPQDA